MKYAICYMGDDWPQFLTTEKWTEIGPVWIGCDENNNIRLFDGFEDNLYELFEELIDHHFTPLLICRDKEIKNILKIAEQRDEYFKIKEANNA